MVVLISVTQLFHRKTIIMNRLKARHVSIVRIIQMCEQFSFELFFYFYLLTRENIGHWISVGCSTEEKGAVGLGLLCVWQGFATENPGGHPSGNRSE